MIEAAARHEENCVADLSVNRKPSLSDGIRHGQMEVRLARTEAEIHAAQELRYKVFYGEMAGRPTAEMVAAGRDFDRFDSYCDHLMVIDHGESGRVVGTYRLLRQSVAERHGGFYTATEFDVSKLMAVPGEIMELGRACVETSHRSRPATMQLLWRGIATYTVHHDVKLMFGCASLPGTDPQAIARALSYLHYNHLAPEHLRARALPDRYTRMDLLSPREVDAEAAVAELAARTTLSALPPLIKGYLRLGGLIGDGAVIDPEFQTTDICIIVVTDRLTAKYFNHYLRVSTEN
ncbi:MAG: L-ornithine Nalpha-acyltransferase [Bradyrhizobium sp.]|jgi:putative hemolysin|nr:L-ornithine Nalpha-acyltransferase [Bradyrhizobium sp.]